jgi:PKD repeat protein
MKTKNNVKKLMTVAIAAFMCLTAVSMVTADEDGEPVHNIDTDLYYSTIQEAIDAVETLDGHTIIVSEITYESIVNVIKDDLTFDLSGISDVSGLVAENKSYILAEGIESTFIGSTSLVFDGMQINTTGDNKVTVNNLNIRINTTADEMMDTTDAPMLVNGQGNEIVIEGVNKFDGRDDKIEFSGNMYYPYGAPGIRVQANRYKPNDELIISGSGELTALGASWCAGIGGSFYRYAGDVTINSGTVIAEGHSHGAGIGGGQDSGRQDETATGIEHNWRPEPSPQVITINGGDVTATGGYGGAGIGTGGDCYNDTHGGAITINGGTVHAYGGDHAAGIGCGQSNAYELDHGTGGDITITDGTIYAISGGDNASGIGGGGTYDDHGLGGNCGTICIYPAATVNATGGSNVDDIGPGLNGDECEFCDLNEDPTAAFSYDPVDPTTVDIIQFTDESIDSDGIIVNWTWDFDDGTMSYDQDPTHQYTSPGNYTVCLTVMDDDDATDMICEVVEVIVPVEHSDVNQSIFDRGFPIRHAVDGDWAAAQNFTPTLNHVSKVELYLRTFGTPEFDLTVELRQDGPQGTLLDTVTFTPAEVPSTWTWFEIDFEDQFVGVGSDVFVVIPPAPSGVTTSFGYEWGYAFGDQYPDGSFWFTRDGGGLWRDLPTMYEFVFKTYGF